MEAPGEVMRGLGAVRGIRLLLLIGLTLLALLVVPRQLAGAEAAPEDLKKCIDAAWPGYNTCLVEADGRFDRWLCDLSFEAQVAFCVAKAIGEVVDAAEGDH